MNERAEIVVDFPVVVDDDDDHHQQKTGWRVQNNANVVGR